MLISDWSSDVCSSDLYSRAVRGSNDERIARLIMQARSCQRNLDVACFLGRSASDNRQIVDDRGGEGIALVMDGAACRCHGSGSGRRSEEHTSELQSLMRSSYAVFCLKKKKRLKE